MEGKRKWGDYIPGLLQCELVWPLSKPFGTSKADRQLPDEGTTDPLGECTLQKERQASAPIEGARIPEQD
jgi:hypothetical protein